MEMAFITATLARQQEAVHMLWGALIGVALAALLAWGWSRFGHRVNLGLFFQVTEILRICAEERGARFYDSASNQPASQRPC